MKTPYVSLFQLSIKWSKPVYCKSYTKRRKKLDFCLYFNFISLLFARVIAKMMIKRGKNESYIMRNNQTAG